jgi:hypothetical protein
MSRTATGIKLTLIIALAIVAISAFAPHGLCQSQQCGVVYYTVTKTYTKVQTVTEVDEVETYTTVTSTSVSGNATVTITSLTPITTTTTRTLTTTYIDVEPGGVLANFSCSWKPPPTVSAPPVSAPTLTRSSDFTFTLLAAVAFGAFAAALVYEITRIVIFLFISTATIWILATAYSALAGLAAGLTALTVTFALAAAFFKR